jgi:hypothetical protein
LGPAALIYIDGFTDTTLKYTGTYIYTIYISTPRASMAVAADSYPVEDGGSDPASEEQRLSSGLHCGGEGLGLRGSRVPADEKGTTFDLAAAGGSEDVRSA